MINGLPCNNRKPGLTHRRPALLTLIATAMVLTASVMAAQVPVVNSPLVPGEKAPGSKAFTLTVNGTGFVSGATVYWNGSARTTTYVKSTQLTASILSTDVTTAGTATVTVANPSGPQSNAAHFEIIKSGFTVAYGTVNYATDPTPNDIAAADFNGDGNVDLVAATGNNSISVLLGNGTGTFPTHVQYGVPGNPVAITVGDFNNDGKLDVATADQYTGQVSVLLGNGDGTFQTHNEYSAGPEPVALATADVNGDGKLDLIVVDQNGNEISVLLGNGDGTFQAPKNYATGKGPEGLAIGDFNGDGKLDVAVANNSDNTVSILLGNGDGTFQTQVTYATAVTPNAVAVGDFNGDGVLDLAVCTSNKSVSVLLGNSNGTFQNHKEYSIGANAFVVVVADVNSDGKLDIVTANYGDNTISALTGKGDGTFNAQAVMPSGATPSGMAIADFNNNGKLDVAVAATSANAAGVLLDSELVLSPGSIGFGTQTSGFVSASKTVSLKNQGTTTYTLGTLSLVGAYPTDFSVTNNCGTTIAAGKECNFTITFDPQLCEYANAQELITNNGSAVGFQMTGTGNTPLTLSPRTMNFQQYQLIGTSSAPKTDTFTNDAGVSIVFSKIDLEGVNESEFNLEAPSSGTNCLTLPGGALGPGAACSTNVDFCPTESGGANVTQVYYGNFCLAKQGLLISGNGTAVKVTPVSITFPTTKVGSTSTSVVTFQNAGSTAMAITSATFTGTAAVFGIQSNTCNFVQGSGGSVPANSSCTFTLYFTPTATGTQTGTFSIGDPDPTGPQVVKLTGTGD